MERCKEDLIERHDTFNTHRKVKEMAQIYRKYIPMTLINDINKIIVDEKKMRNTWELYVSKLFGDTRPTKNTIE